MSTEFELTCDSPERMHAAGEALAGCLVPGDAIALIGDLGAGKTLLIQGVGAGLGVPAATRVTSPTFTLLNEYRGGRLDLYHADLYRIEAAREFEQLGFEEVAEAGGVFAVEWADRFPDRVLPEDHLVITIRIPGEGQRCVAMSGAGPRGQRLAMAWARALGL